MVTTKSRKVNWISRHGHSALMVIQDASKVLDVFGGDLITTPKLLQKSNIELSYTGLSSGLSELEQLGILIRGTKRVEYDNGMADRSFKGSTCRYTAADFKSMVHYVSSLYSAYSVETVAALATVVYIDSKESVVKKGGWFDIEEYREHLRHPVVKINPNRAPTDAAGFVEYDVKRGLYKLNSHDTVAVSCVRTLDYMIEINKPWNTTK